MITSSADCDFPTEVVRDVGGEGIGTTSRNLVDAGRGSGAGLVESKRFSVAAHHQHRQ